MRTLAAVEAAPVVVKQPEPATQQKRHKDKAPKDKPKPGKAQKVAAAAPAAPPQEEQPAPVEQPATPVAPLPSTDIEQDEGGKHDDKEHGDHGKGHDKKK